MLSNMHNRSQPGLGSDYLHSGQFAQGDLPLGMHGLPTSHKGNLEM